VLGLSLDEAKNVALVAAAVFAIGAIAAIWIMKSIVQKVLVAALLAMLAFAAWSQRESLQECAELVQADVTNQLSEATAGAGTTSTSTPGSEPGGTGESSASDASCTFFGVDVTIP